jgi:hypothetical protein
VEEIGSISLVDGEQLAHLMIEFDLGVATTATYKVKKIDQDFLTLGASWSAPGGRVRGVQELRGSSFVRTGCGVLGAGRAVLVVGG